MKNEHLILGLTAIAVTALIAIHYANKGVTVTVGTPLFKAKIN